MTNIPIQQVLPIDAKSEYKIHLACNNSKHEPLDVFIRSWQEWERWNTWRSKKDDFSRKYIFSLIDFYHEPDNWLFGGVFEVTSRVKRDNSHSYKIKLMESTSNFIGRLKVRLKRPARARSVRLENYYKSITVSEILKERYTGQDFCGYENINHDFRVIEGIYRIDKPDWKTALANVKGVYLITDRGNGKRYVGSAYGDTGIWSRWRGYIETGHGGNKELATLIKKHGIEYARANFTFTLLEYRSKKADDNTIIERETYWKEVLLTRGDYGYNKN